MPNWPPHSLRGRIFEIGCGAGPTFRHYYSNYEVIAEEQDSELCLEALVAALKRQSVRRMYR